MTEKVNDMTSNAIKTLEAAADRFKRALKRAQDWQVNKINRRIAAFNGEANDRRNGLIPEGQNTPLLKLAKHVNSLPYTP